MSTSHLSLLLLLLSLLLLLQCDHDTNKRPSDVKQTGEADYAPLTHYSRQQSQSLMGATAVPAMFQRQKLVKLVDA